MVAALAYLVIETADPAASLSFYTDVAGLAESKFGPTADGHYLQMDDHAWRIHLVPGERDRLIAVGLECASDGAFDALFNRTRDAGTEISECADRARKRGCKRLAHFVDPAGNPIEIVVGRRLGYQPFVSPAGVSRFVTTAGTADMGLGHIVLPAPDIEPMRRFWLDVVGLHQTDDMTFVLGENAPEQKLYFMHADNPRHHSVALFEIDAPPSGILHIMLEVPAIDDVGLFIDRCEKHGVVVASTIGRHSNDRMISVYIHAPGGYMIEYGCDGMQLDWRNWITTSSAVPDIWGHRMLPPPAS